MIDIGAEQAVEHAAEVALVGVELVVVLTIFAEQGGRAGRGPGLPPERLHVPGVGVGNADIEEDGIGIRVAVVEAHELVERSAGILALIHAVDTET